MTDSKPDHKSTLTDRMDSDRPVPVLVEPVGGPIPSSADVAAAATEPASNPQADQLQQQWQQAGRQALTSWPQIAQPMVDQLADQAEQTAQTGNTGGYGQMAVPAATIAAIAVWLAGRGARLAAKAAAGLVADAETQGVTITAAQNAGADRVQQTAQATAYLLAAAYAASAARAALPLAGASPDEIRAAVETRLAGLGKTRTGLVADNLGALLSSAQFAALLAVFTEHSPTSYISVEHNDANECSECAKVAGTIYPTLAKALVDYPSGGIYKNCLGGWRCRGYLSPRWT